MLRILIHTTFLHFSDTQPYLAYLYGALFSTAYFGLFRVGEVTSGSHPVKVGDVHIGRNKKKMLFVLRTSKTHGEHDRPQTIKITSLRIPHRSLFAKYKDVKEYCPFELLKDYINLRPKFRNCKEPFFIFQNFSPVTPLQMRTVLKQMLHKSGFNKTLYNCQSL